MKFKAEEIKLIFNKYINRNLIEYMNKLELPKENNNEDELELPHKINMMKHAINLDIEVNLIRSRFEDKILSDLGYDSDLFDTNEDLYYEIIEALREHNKLFEECLKTNSEKCADIIIKRETRNNIEQRTRKKIEAAFRKTIEDCLKEHFGKLGAFTFLPVQIAVGNLKRSFLESYHDMQNQSKAYDLYYLKNKNYFEIFLDEIIEKVSKEYTNKNK